MKILFINFNLGSTPGINNGLAILSAILKRDNHQVKLIFLCEETGYAFDLDRVKQDIINYNPDIIGISLMETQLKYAIRFCENLRNYYPGFLICGGPFPTMDPHGCLSLKGLDAVCLGEGEEALSELVEAIRTGRDYSAIKNLWFKQPDGTIIKNRLRPFKDLNTLPPEDKEIFELDKILPLKNYQLETMLGRGCVYKCSYCINQSYLKIYRNLSDEAIAVKDYVRMKSVDTAIQEIKDSLLYHPQIRKIAFIDDNFMFYNDFLGSFCKRYKEEINLPFMCNANPLSFSLSKAKVLKESGCDDIRFGLESGSERIKRQILKRPIPNQSIINAFKINSKLDIMTSTFNMIGLPTETSEEVMETLRLNAAIMPDTVKIMTFYPFKNTPLYELCENLNLIDHDKKFELDNYDTFTCLKFSIKHQLFLKKVQAVFHWYINSFSNYEIASEYGKLIKDVEKMTETNWMNFDYCSIDKEVSDKIRKKNVPYYAKFLNRSLAVKYPSRHFKPLFVSQEVD